MHVAFEDCGSAVLITIKTSRFDTTTAWEVREDLRECLRDDRDVYLFDLSDVAFIDSSGVGTLVGFVKYAGRSRRIELCGLSVTVQKVLRLTNLLNFFTIHQDLEEGLLAHRAVRQSAIG